MVRSFKYQIQLGQLALLLGCWMLTFSPPVLAAETFADGLQALRQGDPDIARGIWLPLAIDGDPKAQYGMGVIYAKGKGVTRDPKKAVHWYQKSALNGYAPAQFNLGISYQKGRGVARDMKQVLHWWQLAADQSFMPAQYNLGLLYFEGNDVTQDYVAARRWFQLAYDNDSEPAKKMLADIDNMRKSTPSNQSLSDPRAKTSIAAPLATTTPPPAKRARQTTPIFEPAPMNGRNTALESWLLKQPAANYAVQLFASSNEAAVRRYIAALQLPYKVAYYQTIHGGKPWYPVVLGSFGDSSAARTAINTLPIKLKQAKPWPRRYSEIHGSIRKK